MKKVRYSASWFETDAWGNCVEKFKAGQAYPITSESQSHVARGIAEEVDAPDDESETEAASDTPAAAQEPAKPTRTRKA